MDSPRNPTSHGPPGAQSKSLDLTKRSIDAIPTIVPHQDINDSSAPASPQSPDWIGRFKIEKAIGSGGFATVYLGYDEDLQRRVAIKVPLPQRVADAEAYLTEARILASLDHPHIVPVFEVGRTEDGLCFVVSKYIEGASLRGQIQQNRFPPSSIG
jgi:serine/threonine protein kinase